MPSRRNGTERNNSNRRPSHPALDAFRRHSSLHYQSFPSLRPPTGSGKPWDQQSQSSNFPGTPERSGTEDSNVGSDDNNLRQKKMASIPARQLLILAVIALAEQTAFNSISPYLPEMVGLFPDVKPEDVGFSVGMIASAFAVAQFITNFFWGNLSDRIGRKPVILCGTILTACGFVLFAFTTTLREAIFVQAMIGMVNGNQGVVSTVLGDITDRSNQSTVFAYLPVVYSIGAMLGPIVGGLLSSSKESEYKIVQRFPYCLPNLFSALLLVLDFVLCIFFLDESLAEARDLPPLSERIKKLFSWIWQYISSLSKKKQDNEVSHLDIANSEVDPLLGEDTRHGNEMDNDDSDISLSSSRPVSWKQILTPSTIVLLVTYFIFNLAMIGYNALYPIFVLSPVPTGRGLTVKGIGLSLAFAGFVTIIFQMLVFARLQDRVGNQQSFKGALGLFALTFFAMPFIGYENEIGKAWLWIELLVVLTIKVVSSITALTCAMILITNCAPNSSSLGSINGLAQTLSAAGRAFGPFASGGLFTLGTRYNRGEWLPWGVFGGITIMSFFASFGIRQFENDTESTELA